LVTALAVDANKVLEVVDRYIVALMHRHNAMLVLFGTLVTTRQTGLVAKLPPLGLYIVTANYTKEHGYTSVE
jgi:hypothetical protein